MSATKLLETQAPQFSLQNQEGQTRTNANYRGKWLILYFYPKDNTPGCTTEALEFTSLKNRFEDLDCVIVGISPDSTASHQKFIHKQNLSIELLSDPERKASVSFGVWQMKKMAGREYMGVVRTTFLINPDGVVQQVWESVKVKGHVTSVFDHLCSLIK